MNEDILPGKKLVFSWAHVIAHANGEREVTPVSRVEVNFIPNGKGTDVRLVHTALSTEDARHGVGGGWEASFSELSTLFDEPSPPMKTATGGTSGRNRS